MTREELLLKVKNELPASPGVYIMKNLEGEVIYVGKAKALSRRVKSYFDNTPKTPKTYALVSNIHHFDYILTNSELDAFSLECNLIKKYKPKYNILLKDDKSFPYLKIDLNERFPRVQIARRPKQESNVLLFGPYVTGTRVSELLSIIKSAYPVRWCNKNFDGKKYLAKPCLHGEIGNCVAPCVSLANEKEYDAVIKKVIDFLNGKTFDVKKQLKNKMNTYADALNFEDALVVRNQLLAVENMEKELITSLANESDLDVFGVAEQDEVFAVNVMMIRKGKNMGQVNYLIAESLSTKQEVLLQFISSYYTNGTNIAPKEIVCNIDEQTKIILQSFLFANLAKMIRITVPKIAVKKELLKNAEKNADEFLTHSKERALKKQQTLDDAINGLKKLLNLSRLKRIEGYDISNISGAYSVASMVVFENGEPAYKEYRKFKIKTVQGADDYASLNETLRRRLTDLKENKENFNKRPDLILIDGGFGQLRSAKMAMDEVGVSIPIISLAEKNEEICSLEHDKPIVLEKSNNSLKLLQRVRDESHRFAITFHRELRGKSLKSSLSEIEGIGEVKVKALLKHFKSADAVSKASINDLEQVQGIGKEFATKIYEYFHNNIVK